MGPESSLTPETIQAQSFTTAFRGYDPNEVKSFLNRVAGELRAWRERADGLESAWHSAEERAARPPVLDEDTLMAAVGEETAAILRTARQAAAEMRTKASEDAERAVTEARTAAEEALTSARAEAERLRSESAAAAELLTGAAQAEADRLTGEARNTLELAITEGEAETARLVNRAKEEAAALVERAQAEAEELRAEAEKERRLTIEGANSTRDRILEDLARRRRVATVQIEQLRAGRERLIESYALVRRTLEEVQTELSRADAEARTAADEVGRRLKDEPYVELTESTRTLGELLGSLPDTAPPAGGAVPESDEGKEGADGAGAPAGGPVDAPDPAPAADVQGPAAPAGADAPAHPDPAPAAGTGPAVATAPRPSAPDVSDAPEPGGPGSDAPELGLAEPTGASGAGGNPPADEPTMAVDVVDLIEANDPAAAGATEAGAGAHTSAVDELFARIRATRQSVAAVGDRSGPPAAGAEGDPAAGAESGQGSMTTAEIEVISGELIEAMGPADTKPSSRRRGGHQATVQAPAAPTKPRSTVRIIPPETAATPPAPDAPPVPEPAVGPLTDDESLLQAREFAIVDLEVTLTRRLKRALQDEQNDVLDRLRSLKEEPTAANLLPTGEEQVARYAGASQPLLAEAAVAGGHFAAEVLGRIDLAPVEVEVDDLGNDCGSAIASTLRRRLEQAILTGTGDEAVLVESLGAAYREWKTQRIERLAGDILSAAFARGTWRSAPAGVAFRWLVEDVDGPCPDCDDDGLAGALPKGEAFPTGQQHPPAHSGCRCLLVPVAGS